MKSHWNKPQFPRYAPTQEPISQTNSLSNRASLTHPVLSRNTSRNTAFHPIPPQITHQLLQQLHSLPGIRNPRRRTSLPLPINPLPPGELTALKSFPPNDIN